MNTYGVVSKCLLILIGLASLSPSIASAHEPGPARDCSAFPYSPPFASVPASYSPRYNTIAQTFLDMERVVGPVTPSEYAILDDVIDEAKKRLKPIPARLDDTAYETFAVESLKTIDCILVSHGFVYPGIGLVQLLSDGLDPTVFSDPVYYQALLNHRHNLGRTAFIEQRKPGPYYVVDCDIASYMYLAVAEVMKYPLAMVQMPLHNFIRWLRPAGGYIDFETMDGRETDDSYYQALWGIPQKFIGTPGVLTTMNGNQLLAYEHFGLGISFTWKKDIPHAIAEYKKAISVDASLGDSANNLAWLYAVVPDAIFRDGPKAVAYGQEAVAIFPNGDWLDTLACAYGLTGDFAKGVEAEHKAIQEGWAPQGSNLEDDLAVLSGGHPCSDPTFGVDAHPFRPSDPTPTKVLSKDANAVH
jgi:tetratricopeptide (TPR) repeat protein